MSSLTKQNLASRYSKFQVTLNPGTSVHPCSWFESWMSQHHQQASVLGTFHIPNSGADSGGFNVMGTEELPLGAYNLEIDKRLKNVTTRTGTCNVKPYRKAWGTFPRSAPGVVSRQAAVWDVGGLLKIRGTAVLSFPEQALVMGFEAECRESSFSLEQQQ